jgi:YidC/Oxa1 family membrane protein insertase
MMTAQPEIAKLQKKYKGKNDRESRERFAKEQMDLYKRTGSNPLSSCLPLLIQMPIFSGLFFVLNDAQNSIKSGNAGVGLMNLELSNQFAQSSLFGAPLKDTFLSSESLEVKILAAVMILVMTASQFITQKQIMSKNQNPDVMNSQYMQTQKIMLVLFPIIFAISGISFPLGVMFYWLASNFWTMGQQYVVIKSMPTPGSKAYHERQARLEKKGKLKPADTEAAEGADDESVQNLQKQRQQPTGKSRAKKGKK